jgi:hypothetical protein
LLGTVCIYSDECASLEARSTRPTFQTATRKTRCAVLNCTLFRTQTNRLPPSFTLQEPVFIVCVSGRKLLCNSSTLYLCLRHFLSVALQSAPQLGIPAPDAFSRSRGTRYLDSSCIPAYSAAVLLLTCNLIDARLCLPRDPI